MNHKLKSISPYFFNNGIILNGKKNYIGSINIKKIKTLFEKYGIIIFRNFRSTPINFFNFTKKFTSKFSVDAIRREERYNNRNIRSVDIGNHEIPLHSESSFTTTCPDIIWFYCKQAPKKRGKTTICDGINLWNLLKKSTKKFFLEYPAIFSLAIDLNIKTKKKISRREWYLENIGAYNSFINYKKNKLEFEYKKFLINEDKYLNKICFANHLLSVNDERQIKKVSIKNKKIPDSIFNEIKQKSKKITYYHKWQNNDFIMLNNKRFMHGRTSTIRKDIRDILNIQTQYKNF